MLLNLKKLGHQIPKKWIDDLALHTQICVKKVRLIITMEEFYIQF